MRLSCGRFHAENLAKGLVVPAKGPSEPRQGHGQQQEESVEAAGHMQVVPEAETPRAALDLQSVLQHFAAPGPPDDKAADKDNRHRQRGVAHNVFSPGKAAVPFGSVQEPAVQPHHLREEALAVVHSHDRAGVRVDKGGCFLAGQQDLIAAFRVLEHSDAPDWRVLGQLLPRRGHQPVYRESFSLGFLDKVAGGVAELQYLLLKDQ